MKKSPVGQKQVMPARKTDSIRGTRLLTGRLPGHLLGACLLTAFSTASLAHGIHQHGLAHLDISQQESTVTVSFRSPLDSLIGFESLPTNEEQRALARELLEKLQQAPDAVFRLPPAAGCRLDMPPRILAQTLTSSGDGVGRDDHDHGHGHGHGDDDAHAHHHGKGHDHRHDDHEHGHDHEEPHDHDAQRHDHGGSSHSDLSAEYRFSCQHPGKIRSVELTVFQNWPRIHTVETAVVSDRGQKAARLKARQPRLSW